MKIKIKQSTLAQGLELTSRISVKHVTLPVLQCVLIEVKERSVILRTTNLEIGIEVLLQDVQVESCGSVAVPVNVLMSVVQQCSVKSLVELSVNEDGVVEVSTETTSSTIKPIAHDEFPTISQLTVEPLHIQKDMFSLGIKTTAFAASNSSIKPELGSIHIHQKKEQTVTFVATDSFRLMEKTVPQKGCILPHSILLPQKNALELARVLDMVNEEVELLIDENQCALRFKNGVYITSRLVSGTFPDYEQIIPKEYVTNSIVLKQDLQNVLKKTSVFLNKFLQVVVSVSSKRIVVSSQNNETGSLTDEIPAQTDGDELVLSFNQSYLTDSLTYFSDDSLRLQFAGIGRPLVIVGVSDTSTKYLVMPMNK